MSNDLNIKTVYIYYILYFMILPLGFLTRLLYSHTLTLSEFGILYSLYSFFGLIKMSTNLGFSESLKYFIPKYRVQNKHHHIKNIFYYSLFINQIIVILISIILYFLSDWFSVHYFHNPTIAPFLRQFILYFIFSSSFVYLTDILISFKKNLYYQGIYFLQMFIILFLSFFFSKTSIPLLETYIWIIIFSYFIASLFYLISVFKNQRYMMSKPYYNSKLFKHFIKYSFSIFTTGLGFGLLLQIDFIIITYFISTNAVGIYSNATALISTLVSIFSSLTLLVMPYFTELKEKGDFNKIESLLNFLYYFFSYLIMPMALTMFLFPKQILGMIYGADFIVGYKVLMILSLFSIFKIILSYNLSIVNSFGLAKKMIFIIYPIALFNLVLDYILMIIMKTEGIALATGIGWFILTILTTRLIMIQIPNFKIRYTKYLSIILLSFIFVLMVFRLKAYTIISFQYLNSLLILVISYVIYLVMGYLLKVYSVSDLLIFIPSSKFKKKIITRLKKY